MPPDRIIPSNEEPLRRYDKNNEKHIAPKIRKLAETARELYQTKYALNVTRLTSLKSLCQEEKAAANFALYLAKLVIKQMESNQTTKSFLGEEAWTEHCQLINHAVEKMEDYLEEPTPDKRQDLYKLLTQLEQIQGWEKHIRFGTPIRVINNKYALIIEDGLRCMTSSDYAYWSYQMARDYAERYNSSCGSGLTSESAPLVAEIAEFWCQYYFGKTLTEKFPDKS